MAQIELEHLTKVFSGGTVAVEDVHLRVEDGEFMVLVGPSGCGKSTLLRMIAGLEEVTDGQIRVGGRDVTDLAPRRRDVAMVFQSYALYPHMSVRQNIGYGLKVRKTPKAETKRRVGVGAALAQLHARLGVTTVYVTHDQTGAMTLGQRVAVMRDGRILQVDEPQTLYRQPVDLFVAAFIGTPAMNLVEARIDGDEVVFGQFRVPLDPARRPPRDVRSVVLGLRPESFEDSAFAPPEIPRVEAEIEVLEELGSDVHVFFHVDAPRISTEALEAEEDDATLLVEEKALFNARVDPRTRAAIGDRLRLAIDPHRFHFFDPKTGKSLLATEPAPESEPEGVLTT